jgi:hypothetical protein
MIIPLNLSSSTFVSEMRWNFLEVNMQDNFLVCFNQTVLPRSAIPVRAGHTVFLSFLATHSNII